ncbi:glycine cleavage system protein GcvH [bacterium]|nr:glycine cleavage system protein GcvH [bacterium]
MNFPENLLYASSHEWAQVNNSEVTVGITEYAQSELGDIIFVEMPSVGKKVEAGKPLGSIEAVKTVSDLYAPFTGEVIAVNEKLKDEPELINKDCYGSGWIVKIKISDMSAKEKLLAAKTYRESIAH